MSEPETEAPAEPTEPQTEPEPDEAEPEAEPAEPETEIEGPGDDVPPETEPAPLEPSSYALSVEQEKKLATEVKRHTGKVSEILGDTATDLLTCPLCNPDLQGFLYEGDLLNPQTPIQVAVRDALAPAASVDYLQDPDTKMCPRCAGEGETLTGSKNPRYVKKVCSTCNGFGYTPPPGNAPNGVFTPSEERELVAVLAGDAPQEDVDNWGHPRLLPDGRENPNWGRQPQYIDPNFP